MIGIVPKEIYNELNKTWPKLIGLLVLKLSRPPTWKTWFWEKRV